MTNDQKLLIDALAEAHVLRKMDKWEKAFVRLLARKKRANETLDFAELRYLETIAYKYRHYYIVQGMSSNEPVSTSLPMRGKQIGLEI